jgi:hypothetical protein
MGEARRRQTTGEDNRRPEWVVYVVAVTSIKLRSVDNPTAAIDAAEVIRKRLARGDSNVYIPKVMVVAAGDNEKVAEDIEAGKAPWLEELYDDKSRDKEGTDDGIRGGDQSLLRGETGQPGQDNEGGKPMEE